MAHFQKSISLDEDMATKIRVWMRKNEVTNYSLALRHLVKIGLGSRNNGVGAEQKKLLTSVEDIFEEVLEEQKIKKSKVMK